MIPNAPYRNTLKFRESGRYVENLLGSCQKVHNVEITEILLEGK